MTEVATMRSSSSSTYTLTGFFDDKASAQQAIDALVNMGIPRDDITMVAGTGETGAVSEEDSLGFWESLGNLFLPDEDRYSYAEGLRRGGYMVTVHTMEGVSEKVMDIFEEYGSVDLDEREAAWRGEGWSGYVPGSMDDSIVAPRAKEKGWVDVAGIQPDADMDVTTRTTAAVPPLAPAADSYGTDSRAAFAKAEIDKEVIPVMEENLRIGKREVGHGRVRVRSYVIETPVSEEVTLRQERVSVERHAVDRPLTGAEDAFRERTIELDEKSEEAVISKEARVKEEITLNKEVEHRTDTVSDTVRHTEVEVEDDRTMIDKGAATTRTTFDRDRR